MKQSEWFMKVDFDDRWPIFFCNYSRVKVDSDTYVNADRLAVDISNYRRIAAAGGGTWQYGGYHNNGKVKVFADPAQAQNDKQRAWLEVEYGKTYEFYPPYAFGAA
eukprot:scaffold106577_cov45-Prasinocladus_malaysianus.AAC.3